MVTLTIDGKDITVEPGTTIIQAAENLGISIPHYCYHPALTTVGSCRLCLIEVEGAPRLMVACGTPANDGMVVHTASDQVENARKIVLEFLLLNHPIDCPVCDKAGECHLQDYSFEYGSGHSRFKEPKRIPPFKDFGDNIKLATTRCILCSRCVRFMDEIAGEAQLRVINRGFLSEIATAHGNNLEHPLAGNVVDICPVGALLDKNFIHKTRVWNLTRTPSVCGECSSGCNISVDAHHNTIFRIVPRSNPEVNDYWICDTGRYAYKNYSKLDRLTIPHVREGDTFVETSWDEALQVVAEGIRNVQKTKNSIAGLVSPASLNEDAFAVIELLKYGANSTVAGSFFQRPSEEDRQFNGGFVIKGDKFPNQEGLKYIFGLDEFDYLAESVLKLVESGDVKVVYCVHNDRYEIPEKVMNILRKIQFLIVEDTEMSPIAQIAHVVLPGKMYYEKSGTFVNYNKQIQVVQKAVNAPEGTKSTCTIVKEIAALQKQQLQWFSESDVFLKMAKHYPELDGLSHFKIGALGVPLYERTKAVESVS